MFDQNVKKPMKPPVFAITAQRLLVSDNLERQQNKLRSYNQKGAFILGILQMVVGVLCAVCNIVSLVGCSVGSCSNSIGAYISGYGIWCGAFYFVPGLLGVLSGNGIPTRSLITATMVMSIVAATIFCPTSFSLGLIDATSKLKYSSFIKGIRLTKENDVTYADELLIAMSAMEIILSVMETVIAAASSFLCCQVACFLCCQRSSAYLVADQHSSKAANEILPNSWLHSSLRHPTKQCAFHQFNSTASSERKLKYLPF